MAINGKRDIALASDPRSGLEMVLLRMLAFRPQVAIGPQGNGSHGHGASRGSGMPSVEAGKSAKKRSEPPLVTAEQPSAAVQPATASIETAAVVAAAKVAVNTAPTARSDSRSTAQKQPPASEYDEAADLKAVEPPQRPEGADASLQGQTAMLSSLTPETWTESLAAAGLVGIVYTIASNCELRARSDDELQFILDPANAALFNDSHVTKIRLALENYFGQPLKVSITPGELQLETPAMVALRRKRERQQEAEQAINSDVRLQQLIERFDGTLDQTSITPIDS
jgi:DNA polymerase-3 subunit gamma/tau